MLCVMTTNYNLPSDQITEGHSENQRESGSGVTSLLVSRQEPSPSEEDKRLQSWWWKRETHCSNLLTKSRGVWVRMYGENVGLALSSSPWPVNWPCHLPCWVCLSVKWRDPAFWPSLDKYCHDIAISCDPSFTLAALRLPLSTHHDHFDLVLFACCSWLEFLAT